MYYRSEQFYTSVILHMRTYGRVEYIAVSRINLQGQD